MMNCPEQLIPSTYALLPKPRSSRLPSSAYNPDTSEQDETSASEPALFLAWSSSHAVADRRVHCEPHGAEMHLATASPVRAWSGRRDRGLWLLHEAFIRHEGWSRLNTEPIDFPEPHQSSLHPSYAVVKRAADVAASLALLVLLLPVFALVAALVKLDSRGPAIFRQRRVGTNGKEFLLWKFRSMHVDAPKYAPSPTSDSDRRLTRIGHLIRRMSIDELPQLINVLKGEMSIVGPRPEMPFIVDRYTSLERERLAVKPGITGLWQVSPARARPIHENLRFDLHYIRHQNLVLDAAILLRTISAVIRGVGAV